MCKSTVKINNDLYEVYNDDSLVIKTNIKILADTSSKLINHFLEFNTDGLIANLGEVALIDAMTQWVNSVIDTLHSNELQGVLFSWEGNTISLDNEKNIENLKYDTLNIEISDDDKNYNEFILGRLCKVINEFCDRNSEHQAESYQKNYPDLFSVVLKDGIYNVVFENDILIKTNNNALAFTSKKILNIIEQTVEDLNDNDKIIMLLITVLSTWIEQTCSLFNNIKIKGILFSWESKIMPAKSLNNCKYDSRNIYTTKEEMIRTNEIINNYCTDSLKIFNESNNDSNGPLS